MEPMGIIKLDEPELITFDGIGNWHWAWLENVDTGEWGWYRVPDLCNVTRATREAD